MDSFGKLLAKYQDEKTVDDGFHLIPVSHKEFENMGTNVLALAPGHCVMLEGNPTTQQRLEAAGCQDGPTAALRFRSKRKEGRLA